MEGRQGSRTKRRRRRRRAPPNFAIEIYKEIAKSIEGSFSAILREFLKVTSLSLDINEETYLYRSRFLLCIIEMNYG